MTVGQELADARRKLGLSLTDLSARTRLSPGQLRAIEETDLGALPPGLDDSIRSYATAVQLHADEVTARYLAHLPIVLNPAASLNAFESEADAPDDVSGSDLLVYEPVHGQSSSVRPALRPASTASPQLILRSEPDLGHGPPRQDEPLHYYRQHRHTPLEANHRLPIAGLILISVLAAGGYMWSANRERVWSMRSQRADAEDRAAPAADARDGDPDASVARAVAPDAPSFPPAPASANAESVPADDATKALPSYKSSNAGLPSDDSRREKHSTPRAASPSRELSRSADEVPSALIVVPGSAPAPASAGTRETAKKGSEAAGALSGSWNVVRHSQAPLPDVDARGTLAYRLQLVQHGNRVTGRGYSVIDDGSDVSSGKAINVVGTLSGDRLTLDFSGLTSGRFVVYRAEDGAFHGRYRRGVAASGESSLVTLILVEHAQ